MTRAGVEEGEVRLYRPVRGLGFYPEMEASDDCEQRVASSDLSL